MVNNVIRVVNYLIAAHPSLLNLMIADTPVTHERWSMTLRTLRHAAAGTR